MTTEICILTRYSSEKLMDKIQQGDQNRDRVNESIEWSKTLNVMFTLSLKPISKRMHTTEQHIIKRVNVND